MTPEWDVELVGIAQDAAGHEPSPVKATLRRKDGALEQVPTPWLISAEGAHSVARTTLDLQFEGKTLDEQYALGDLFVDGDLADIAETLTDEQAAWVVRLATHAGRRGSTA